MLSRYQNYDFDRIPAQNISIPILKQYQGKNLKHQESNEIIYDSPDRNKGLHKKGQQRIEIYATFQLFYYQFINTNVVLIKWQLLYNLLRGFLE